MDVFTRNNVKITGDGTQPMIFAHGFGCDQNMWRLVTPAFADEYRLVLFDLVGTGGSDLTAYSPEKYSSLHGYADDLLEIIDTLELNDIVFVGHSVSCMIGVLAAIRRPERFAKLVLVAPSPRYVNDVDYVGGLEPADVEELLELLDHNYLGWSSAMAPLIMSNSDRPQLAEELHNSFCRTHPDIARHFGRVTFLGDNRADLPQLNTPALILQCTDDAIAPVAVGRYMQQQLPHSELVLLEVSGHCPHLSAPDTTIAAIRSFL